MTKQQVAYLYVQDFQDLDSLMAFAMSLLVEAYKKDNALFKEHKEEVSDG